MPHTTTQDPFDDQFDHSSNEKPSVVLSPSPSLAYEAEEATVHLRKIERRFLWKLDICLLTWAWFAYCIKQIDASNYKTAYASGMQQSLSLYGNELNYLDTFYRIGYALCLIPSQLILTKVPASWWLPPLEIAWGIMTALMAVPKSVQGMYALRFLIGAFEASSYPGIISILCSWYTPTELATRIAIFGTSYPGANIFVSFMQAALHKTMNGKAGLEGWQWLFILNGLMTIVVASAGFFLLPDSPTSTRVRWLNADEQAIARLRVDRVRKLPPTTLSWACVKRVLKSSRTWAFTIAYATWSWSQNSNSWIILFLKAAKNADGTKRFGISELNAIPIGGYVLQIIAMLFFAWLSDKTGHRATLIIVQQVTLLIGTITLSVWPASFGVKMWAYYMLWLSNAAGPTLVAWMADYTPSPEDRAIIIGLSVTLVFIIDSWANILIYPAKQAPHYAVGFKAASGFAVACIAATVFFWAITRRLTPAAEVVEEGETQGESEKQQAPEREFV